MTLLHGVRVCNILVVTVAWEDVYGWTRFIGCRCCLLACTEIGRLRICETLNDRFMFAFVLSQSGRTEYPGFAGFIVRSIDVVGQVLPVPVFRRTAVASCCLAT